MGLGGNFRKGQVLRTSSCGGQPFDEFNDCHGPLFVYRDS